MKPRSKGGATLRAKDGTMRGIEAHRGAPKLTEAALALVCAEIEKGMPVETACRLVDVWPSALQKRMAEDPELGERVERARARAQRDMLLEHRQLAKEGERTNGHEFLLSRLWPRQFAPPPKTLEQSGPDGGPVESTVKVTIEQAREGARGKEPGAA